MENKELEFKNRIKSETTSMDKKLKNIYARKDAQAAEQKRKEEYLKAINEKQEER